MRNSLILMIVGLAAITAPVVFYVHVARTQESDIDDISRMRDQLDSTRAVLVAATAAADSARIAQNIQTREQGISTGEYHLPVRRARLEGWWRPLGLRTIMVVLGVAAVLVGLALFRRERMGVT